MSRSKFQLHIKDFEFNLHELTGSMGDFGTLFPLAVGYFAVNGMNYPKSKGKLLVPF